MEIQYKSRLLTEEAKAYLLRLMLDREKASPVLYAGLTKKLFNNTADLKTLTEAELKATGYSRQAIAASDWAIDEKAIKCKSAIFKNDSTETWPEVHVMFISTSKDSSGILLAWSNLKMPRQLFAGDELWLPIELVW